MALQTFGLDKRDSSCSSSCRWLPKRFLIYITQQKIVFTAERSSVSKDNFSWIKSQLSANSCCCCFTNLSLGDLPWKRFSWSLKGALSCVKSTCMLGFELDILAKWFDFFRDFNEFRNVLKNIGQPWKIRCFWGCSGHKGPRQTALDTECSCICQLLSKPWNIHMFMLC